MSGLPTSAFTGTVARVLCPVDPSYAADVPTQQKAEALMRRTADRDGITLPHGPVELVPSRDTHLHLHLRLKGWSRNPWGPA